MGQHPMWPAHMSSHCLRASTLVLLTFILSLTANSCCLCSYRDDVILSLNNRDPVEGDDKTMTNLGIVSGDLVYVLSDHGQPGCAAGVQKSNCELCSDSSTTVASSSGSESVVRSDVAKMEMDICTVKEHCVKPVINNTGDADRTTEYSKTMLDEKEYSSPRENMDSLADDGHEIVVDAGYTGVPYAMSAEELQLVNHYLNEPMVIREATDHVLPQTLILADSVIQPQTPDAALLTVIDVLMSELGYQQTTVRASKIQIFTLMQCIHSCM